MGRTAAAAVRACGHPLPVTHRAHQFSSILVTKRDFQAYYVVEPLFHGRHLRMDYRIRRRVAFSLVELLVVIGIIAALISVLLPTLARARNVSRSVACKARLEQLGAAVQMYLNQNKTHYPQAPAALGQSKRLSNHSGLPGTIREQFQ